MNAEDSSTTLDIEQYVHVLRRQWRLIVAVAIVGLLGGVGFMALAPRQYTTTSTVNLTVISTEPFAARSAPSSLLDDQEERAIAKSHVVAERAAESMGGDTTASEIRESSEVSTSSGAAVVTVAFTAGSPQQATSGADAVASAYLSYRRDRADERIGMLVDGLTVKIDDIEEQIAEIDDQLSALEPGAPSAARHTTERSQMLTELDGLLAERNGLQGVDTTAGYVLSSAADNAMATAPSRRIVLLTGLAAGVVLGVVAAFLRNPGDRRLRTAHEVARALGAPILARLDSSESQIPARDGDAMALRMARERLLGGVGVGETLVVIDAGLGARVSSTALNLAVLIAQSGRRVQLIVPEEPQHLRMRLSGVLEPGEFEAHMLGSEGLLRLARTGGRGGEERQDLLVTPEIVQLIEGADRRTLSVLVMSTAAEPASLLAALRVSQTMVLVARERTTSSTEVAWMRQEAAAAGTSVLGTIVESSRRDRGTDSRRAPSRAQRRHSARSGGSERHPERRRSGQSVTAVS